MTGERSLPEMDRKRSWPAGRSRLVCDVIYQASYSSTPRDRFVDQFEWDDDGWLYRWKSVGPGYRVKAEEMDRLVAAYDRGDKRAFWIVLPILLLVWSVLFFVSPFKEIGSSDAGLSGLRVAGVILFGPLIRRLVTFSGFRAPLRFLEHRIPVAPALSKAERRQIAAERIEPGGVIFAAIIGGGVLLVLIAVSGWSTKSSALYFVGLGVLLLCWALVESIRKWVLPRPA